MDNGDPVVVRFGDPSEDVYSTMADVFLWTGQDVLLCSMIGSGTFLKDHQPLDYGLNKNFLIRNFKWDDHGYYNFTTARYSSLTGAGRHLVPIDRPSDGGSGFCLMPVSHLGGPSFRKWQMMKGKEVHFLAVKHPHDFLYERTDISYKECKWFLNEMLASVEEKLVVGATQSQMPGTKEVMCKPRRPSHRQGSSTVSLVITEPSTIERGVVWLNVNLVSASGHVFHCSRSDKWPVCRRGVIAGGRMEFICACQDDELLHEWYLQGNLVQRSRSNMGSRLILKEVEYGDHGEYYCRHPGIEPLPLESQHCILAVLEPTMKQSTWDVYLRQLAEGSTIIHEQRIILCGPGRAGKSSVKRSLFGEEFMPQLDSTVGMELWRACCTVECTDEGMKWAKVEDEDEHRDMLLTTAMSQCAAQELGNEFLQESFWETKDYDANQLQGHGVSGRKPDGGEQSEQEGPRKKCVTEIAMGKPAGRGRGMKTPRQTSEDRLDTNQGGANLQPKAGKWRAELEEMQRGEGEAEDAKRAKKSIEEKAGSLPLSSAANNYEETSSMDRHLGVETSEVLALSGPSSLCIPADQYHGVSRSVMEELRKQQPPLITADIACTSFQSDSHRLAFANSGQFHSTSANSPALDSVTTNPKPPSRVGLEPQQANAPAQVILEQPQQLQVTARSAIKAAERRIRNIRRNAMMVRRAASMKWRFITLWDFAGQEAFAIVQHLLMSHKRTAYGVVYDALWPLDGIASEKFGKEGKNMEVERETTTKETNFDVLTGWLEVLHHVFSKSTDTGYSPLLYIICTHADEMLEEQRFALRQEILKRIEGKPYERDIRDVVFVDNTRSGEQGNEDPTIVMLRTELITAMESDSSMQIPIPLKWLPFVVSMRKLVENEGRMIVPLQQVKEIATSAGTTDCDEKTAALIAFCHSLGHILHFSDNEQLSQKVVISVEWLVKVVSMLFVPISVYKKLPSNRQFVDQYRLLYRQGILLETLAVHIWSQNLPPEYAKHLQAQEQRTYLFELMEEYGLLISASESPAMPGDKSTRRYWVPAMVGVEITEVQEEDAAFSRMEKDSEQAPVRRSLPVYLHCSDGQQFPRSLFWRLVACCMQHYRQIGDSEGALPILYRSSIRLLCDSAHWLLLRRYQCGLQVIIEQEESPLADQQHLSLVCQNVLALVEGELASLAKITFGNLSWCLSARCRCCVDTCCESHQRVRCPFVDCQHFVPLDKPRCRHPMGTRLKQDVSAVQRLWLSNKTPDQELLASESSALPVESICAAVTHHFELFRELFSTEWFLRSFYGDMLLSPQVVKAIKCSTSMEDANRKLVEAVVPSGNAKTLAMFLSLLGKHGYVGLIETILSCPGATCKADGNSYHGNHSEIASLAAPSQHPTLGLPSIAKLAPGSVLKEADPELFELAQQLAFSSFELKYFAELLLENSGCRQSGKVFLAGLDVHEFSTVPHKTLAVLQYWIQGAPGPSHERHGGQLEVVLEKLERNNVIRDFNAYLNHGINRPESKHSQLALAATDNNSARRG